MVLTNIIGTIISLIEIIIYINYQRKYPISTVESETNIIEESKKDDSEIKNFGENKIEDDKEEPEPKPVKIINQNDNSI